jgi:hypothetical protein
MNFERRALALEVRRCGMDMRKGPMKKVPIPTITALRKGNKEGRNFAKLSGNPPVLGII